MGGITLKKKIRMYDCYAYWLSHCLGHNAQRILRQTSAEGHWQNPENGIRKLVRI